MSDDRAKKFLHYDFPKSMVNCTPGTFLYLDKVVTVVDGKETVNSAKRNCLVWTKPKYFVGSSGSVWGSHLAANKHMFPTLHMMDDANLEYSVSEIAFVLRAQDHLTLFKQQTLKEDVLLVEKGDQFKTYELMKLDHLTTALNKLAQDINSYSQSQLLSNLGNMISLILEQCGPVRKAIESCQGYEYFEQVNKIMDCIVDFQNFRKDLNFPRFKSRVVDLTDAGPGVGVSNYEVMYRSAQDFLINDYDYYIRCHLAPEDSSQNEVERYQSSIGEYRATNLISFLGWNRNIVWFSAKLF